MVTRPQAAGHRIMIPRVSEVSPRIWHRKDIVRRSRFGLTAAICYGTRIEGHVFAVVLHSVLGGVRLSSRLCGADTRFLWVYDPLTLDRV